MQAYPIAYNAKSNLLRIYDMTPSAKVTVYDYSYGKVYQAVKNKKIELVGTRIGICGLMYRENSVVDLPDWEKPKDANKLFGIGHIKRENGVVNALLVDINGNLIEMSLAELSTIPSDNFTNCYVNYDEGWGVGVADGKEARLMLTGDEELPTFGINILDLENHKGEVVVVPSDVDGVINGDKSITLKIESRHSIGATFFYPDSNNDRVYFNTVEFIGEVDNILYGGIGDLVVQSAWILPKRAKHLWKNSLQRLDNSIVNLYDYEETELREGVLDESKIGLLVLPKGLRAIHPRTMLGTTIGTAYFPPSITEISKPFMDYYSTFTNIGTVVVIRGSNAHIFFSKRKRTQKIIFDTEQEALEYLAPRLNGPADSDTTSIERIRMAFGDSDDPIIEDILTPKYESNAKQLIKLYSRLQRKGWVNTSSIPLKTDKFQLPGLPAEDFGDDLLIKFKINLGTKLPKSTNELSNEFKILCNYITDNSESMNAILTKENTSRIRRECIKDGCNAGEIRVVYMDEYATILDMELHIQHDGWRPMLPARLVMIALGTRIVYVASCKRLARSSYITDEIRYRFIQNEYEHDIVDLTPTIDIADQLCSGFVHSNLVLNSVKVPGSLAKMFYDRLSSQLLVADTDYNPNRAGSGVLRYLSLKTGTMLEFKFRNYGEGISSSGLSIDNMTHAELVVKNKYEYRKWPSKVAESMKYRLFSDKSETNMLLEEIQRDTESCVQGIKPESYDKFIPCYEWKLSGHLNLDGIESIDQIDTDILKKLLKSAYFCQTTEKSLKGKLITSSKSVALETSDGTTVYKYDIKPTKKAYPILGVREERVYLVESSDKSVDGRYFYGYEDFPDVLKEILKFYNPSAKKFGYITDSEEHGYGDRDSMLSLHYYCKRERFVLHSSIILAVSRRNGQLYLVTNFKCQDKYKLLLRLRCSIHDIMKSQIRRYRLDSTPDLTNLSRKIYNEYGEYNKEYSVIKIRDTIMDGLPNGYLSDVTNKTFLDLIAKQPKWAKDKPLGG